MPDKPVTSWVCMVNCKAYGFGTVVDEKYLAAETPGGRGLAILDDGTELFVKKVVREDWANSGLKALEPGRLDGRALPILKDCNGERYGDPKSTVDKMKDTEFDDWPVLGPHTTVWLVRFMILRAGSCMGYHERWMSEVKLDYSAAGTVEHQGWCRFLDTAISWDFLDLGKIAAAEIGARRVQMIHDKWKHKMPQFTGPDGQDEMHLMMGSGEMRGNVAMSPELTRWLGEEMAREALAAKERRKPRGERALAANKK
jgi:hypothetical protein